MSNKSFELYDKKYNNCFALNGHGCRVLKELVCRKGKCTFYKSHAQDRLDRIKYPLVEYDKKKYNK